jgi:predicted ATPase
MAIRRIHVRNFKSFKDAEIQLSPLTVLLGANASGKTNLVHLFRFLRDISRWGLEDAVYRQGGVDYLLNRHIGTKEPLEVDVEADTCWTNLINHDKGAHDFRAERVRYAFAVQFSRDGKMLVLRDDLQLVIRWFVIEPQRKPEIHPQGQFYLTLRRDAEHRIEIDAPFGRDLPLTLAQFLRVVPVDGIVGMTDIPFNPSMLHQRVKEDSLLIETDSGVIKGMFRPFLLPFAYAGVHDFQPNRIRQACKNASGVILEEDGSNLSMVLRGVLSNPEKARKLRNLLSVFVRHIEDVRIVSMGDGSLGWEVDESFESKEVLPAPYLSDGVAQIVALLVVLYFSEKRFAQVLVIEEPDRHIYPYFIERLVATLQEASAERQVIITTHNPEVVRHVPLESLRLVSRDQHGLSSVSEPASSEHVQNFLKDELGVDFLFAKDLLSA